MPRMIVTTTENVPGARVTNVLGQVFGLTVRSRSIGGNIAAGFRSIVGGEVGSYVKLLEDTRRQALDRMVQSATAMGANAVVMMRFDSSEIGQTMTEVVAYGTAVVIAAAGAQPQPQAYSQQQPQAYPQPQPQTYGAPPQQPQAGGGQEQMLPPVRYP